MTVQSKTVEVGGNNSVDVQPKQGSFRITSIVTDQGLGVKFLNDDGDETKVMFKNESDFDVEVFVRDSNWMALETTGSNSQTGFLSIEVV